MISAPSRQRPSSGNNLPGLLCLLLLLLLASCKTTDKVPRKTRQRPTRPVVKKDRKPTAKVDTVSYTEIEREVDRSKETAIDDFGESTSSSYQVSVLMPFDAQNKQRLGDSQDRFVNYYAGMLMAIDILNNQEKRIDIDVHDIGQGGKALDDQVRQLSDEVDLIVAPFRKEQVKSVATYGKRSKTTVVSPWLVSSKATKSNPYYVKLMPDLTEYYKVIMEQVSSRFDKEQVVIIGNDSDASKMKYLQSVAQAMYRTGNQPAVEQFVVDTDSLAYGETAFDNIFDRPDTLVVIIPNYSASDEAFVYNSVRRLAVERLEHPVVAYGMPLMLDSDRMEYDYFKALNMHVARSKFVDHQSSRVQAFKRDYFARFGAIPTDDAYEGYDMMMYLGEQLWEHGSAFQTIDGELSDSYLQSSFQIVGKPKKGVEMISSPADVDYYVNKHIDIIRFHNGRFAR